MDKFLDERNAAYDHLAKRLLAHKSILAYILKYAVSEFVDCSLDDIAKKYIELEFLGLDKNFGWRFFKSKEPLC